MLVVIIIISKISHYIQKNILSSAQSVSELKSKDCRSPIKQSEGTKLGNMSPLLRFIQGPSCIPHPLVSQSANIEKASASCLFRFAISVLFKTPAVRLIKRKTLFFNSVFSALVAFTVFTPFCMKIMQSGLPGSGVHK